jgi:hypothetical protein
LGGSVGKGGDTASDMEPTRECPCSPNYSTAMPAISAKVAVATIQRIIAQNGATGAVVEILSGLYN